MTDAKATDYEELESNPPEPDEFLQALPGVRRKAQNVYEDNMRLIYQEFLSRSLTLSSATKKVQQLTNVASSDFLEVSNWGPFTSSTFTYLTSQVWRGVGKGGLAKLKW